LQPIPVPRYSFPLEKYDIYSATTLVKNFFVSRVDSFDNNWPSHCFRFAFNSAAIRVQASGDKGVCGYRRNLHLLERLKLHGDPYEVKLEKIHYRFENIEPVHPSAIGFFSDLRLRMNL